MQIYLTIGKLFEQTVMKFRNKEALVDHSRGIRWTFIEWNEEVNRLANALIASGVRKGDRVSTFLFNSYELGTDFVVMCGNTPHIVFEQIQQKVQVPMISIVEETYLKAQELSLE